MTLGALDAAVLFQNDRVRNGILASRRELSTKVKGHSVAGA